MNILTIDGYKPIEDITSSDLLLAYDMNDGSIIYNHLINKQYWTSPCNPDDPDFTFYLINNTWTLYKDQSIWKNSNEVCHISELQIGDIIFDDQNNDVIVTAITTTTSVGWWRLEISGDHSFINDTIQFHNASRFWVGGGASTNWNATANTNWGAVSGVPSNASVPSSADDVTFDGAGLNGNTACIISATANAKTLTVTAGFTSSITWNAGLTVAGNVTFGANMTIAGSSTMTINTTASLTSNGKTISIPLTFSANVTYTYVDDWTISGLITISNSITWNWTSSSLGRITSSGGITFASNGVVNGTTTLTTTGGTLTGAGNGAITAGLRINWVINGNITLVNTIAYQSGTLSYSGGTITSTGSTLRLTAASTIDTNTMLWNNITTTTNGTITLNSDLRMTGTFNIDSSTTTVTVNSNNVYIGGDLIAVTGGTTHISTGTAVFIMNGTGSIIANSGVLKNSLTINTSGTTTLSGVINYNTGTFKYLSGTTAVAGSTLTMALATNLDLNGMALNNVSVPAVGTVITFNSTANIGGALTSSGTSASHNSFVSATGGTRVFMTLLNGGTQDMMFTDGTDIDSSLGQTIWTYKGTLSNTVNWNLLPTSVPNTSFISVI